MKALISILSVAGLLLVSACGASNSSPVQGNSDPNTTKLVEWEVNGYHFETFCRNSDKVFAARVYGGFSISVVPNHKECEGK